MSQRTVLVGIVLVVILGGLTGAPTLAQTNGFDGQHQQPRNVVQQGTTMTTTAQATETTREMATTQMNEAGTTTENEIVDPANQSLITLDRLEIRTLTLVNVQASGVRANNVSGVRVGNATNGSTAAAFDDMNVSRAVLENVTLRNVTIRDPAVAEALFENATNYTPDEDRELTLQAATLRNLSIQGLAVDSLVVTESGNITLPNAAATDQTAAIVDEVPPDVEIENATVGNVKAINATGQNLSTETEKTTTG